MITSPKKFSIENTTSMKVRQIQEKVLDAKWTQSFLCRKSLITKLMSPELRKVMNMVGKLY